MFRWIMLLCICALGLAGCATNRQVAEPLSVSLAGVNMLEFGLLEQKLGFKVRVQNPNNVAVQIEGLNYTVELNGKSFAKGAGPAHTEVPAFGNVEIETEAISNLSGLISQFGTLKSERKLQYRLIGKLYTVGGASAQAFDSTGEIGLPELNQWQDRLQPQ